MGLSVHLMKKVKGFNLDVAWEINNELTVLFGYSGSWIGSVVRSGPVCATAVAAQTVPSARLNMLNELFLFIFYIL